MGIGFLFGWAKEQGVDLPTKADGSINIPAAFALYDEWKKKGAGGRAKDETGGTDSKGGTKNAEPEVVELDENSEEYKRGMAQYAEYEANRQANASKYSARL